MDSLHSAECSAPCDTNAECIDVGEGVNVCVCNDGFEGNGQNCGGQYVAEYNHTHEVHSTNLDLQILMNVPELLISAIQVLSALTLWGAITALADQGLKAMA